MAPESIRVPMRPLSRIEDIVVTIMVEHGTPIRTDTLIELGRGKLSGVLVTSTMVRFRQKGWIIKGETGEWIPPNGRERRRKIFQYTFTPEGQKVADYWTTLPSTVIDLYRASYD